MAAEPTAEEMAAAPFLPRLTDRFTRLQRDTQIQTAGFCEAMALILPVFDHLGEYQAAECKLHEHDPCCLRDQMGCNTKCA